MENPIKMDDLGLHLFLETSILKLVDSPLPGIFVDKVLSRAHRPSDTHGEGTFLPVLSGSNLGIE